MCNLYHLSPTAEISNYFKAQVHDELPQGAVGPFGQGVFIRQQGGRRQALPGQWGMIAPRASQARPASRAILTNNARIESVAERPTYRDAWRGNRRCIIPAQSYQEPNWETGRNVWWQMRRIDGLPCLMITAELDAILSPAMAAGMPDHIGDLETHMVAGSGHWTQQEAPAQVTALLLDWLKQL